MWFCQTGIDLMNLTNDPNQVWGKAGDLDLENEALGIQMAKRGNKPILVLEIVPYITGGSWVAWVGWALIVFFFRQKRDRWCRGSMERSSSIIISIQLLQNLQIRNTILA